MRERQGDEELAAKKLEKEVAKFWRHVHTSFFSMYCDPQINRLREDTMRKIKEQEELLRQEEEQHQQGI